MRLPEMSDAAMAAMGATLPSGVIELHIAGPPPQSVMPQVRSSQAETVNAAQGPRS